ncbi:MAG: gephyrin-like molybdotransferase Glp [Gemmatimonadota bacterium]
MSCWRSGGAVGTDGPRVTPPGRLSVQEAANAIVAAVAVQPTLRIPLANAVGHVLAEDVTAAISLPPWTNAAMDGYAVRAADVKGATPTAPVTLRVVGVSAAGDSPTRGLLPGEAIRIYTGAPVPDGADSVVRQEDSDRGVDAVVVHDDRDAGMNLRGAGGDIARGAVALPAGAEVGPHQLALLAALGVAHPVVHRKPRVGILVSGDELVSLDQQEEILDGTRLSDVNGPALAALVHAAGGVPVALGIVRDDPDALTQRVMAAQDIDLLITAGGVSVGDHDYVHAVMARLYVSPLVQRVRLRPGGPTTFGVMPDGRGWLALPGNPVSAMVTFELFARPAIRKMAGQRVPQRRMIRVVVDDVVRRDAVLDQYLRVVLEYPVDGGLPRARLTGPQGSGMLTSVARADALLHVDAGTDGVARGTTLLAVPFGASR